MNKTFYCKVCDKDFSSNNKTTATCECGKRSHTIKKVCQECGKIHYGSYGAPNCRQCAPNLVADKNTKSTTLDSISSRWDVPKDYLNGVPKQLHQTIKCSYFVNRELTDRIKNEAKTIEDVSNIRSDFFKKTASSFGVSSVYGG